MKRMYRVSSESDCTNSRMSATSVTSIERICTIGAPHTGLSMRSSRMTLSAQRVATGESAADARSERRHRRFDDFEKRCALEIARNKMGGVGGYPQTEPRLI